MAEKLSRRPPMLPARGMRAESQKFGLHALRRNWIAAAQAIIVVGGAAAFVAPLLNTKDAAPAARREPAVRVPASVRPPKFQPPAVYAAAPPAVGQPFGATDPRVAEIAAVFDRVEDAAERAALAGEMAGLSDPAAVRALLGWIGRESDPDARRDLLYALAAAEARVESASEIVAALRGLYANASGAEERGQILELAAEIRHSEGVAFLRGEAARADADPYDQLAACESLMQVAAAAPDLVGDQEIQELESRLQVEAQASAEEPAYQAQAILALGMRKEENREFFQQMLASATNPNVRILLANLTQ